MLATAKIHILKQFTTEPIRCRRSFVLCLLLQRYTFWSNSQRASRKTKRDTNCACYCKDTHFEAIHNISVSIYSLAEIVLATAKIHILKQFTTFLFFHISKRKLCLLLQRYTFWSNSQHDVLLNRHCFIVLATAKIHILKQFTTTEVWFRFWR